MREWIKKGDIIIICTACLIAAVLFLIPLFFSNKSKVAVIVEDGTVIEEIDLASVTESYELKINGGRLLIERNQISYIEADCPDHICIRTGILKNAGDTAACVPNKTCVYIRGKDTIDAVTY